MMRKAVVITCTILLCSTVQFCAAATRDSIATGSSINAGISETHLVSPGKIFELGFFTRGNKRYVGIWYYTWKPSAIVWVANRNDPVPDSATAFFRLENGTAGTLALSDSNGVPYVSFRFGSFVNSTTTTLRLLDSGNLVVRDDQSGRSLWESFDHPTDTFLPGMKMNGTKLISWSGPDDPREGNYSFESAQSSYVIMRGYIVYWRSKESSSFISIDRMYYPAAALLSNSTNSLVNNIPSRLVMNSSGEIQYFTWQNTSTQVTAGWSLAWSEPRDKCSVFNACGNFGICNNKSKDHSQYCECLPDFEPTLPEKWNSGDFSSGCKRKLEICREDSGGDKFLNLKMMRARKPEETHFFRADSEDDCRKACLSSCQCQAYSYNEPYSTEKRDHEDHGCWIWITELINLQEDYTEDGHNISVRVVNYSKGHEKKHMSIFWKIAVTVTVVFFTALLLCSICFILYRRRMVAKIRGSREETRALRLYETQRWARNLIGSGELKEDDKKGIDVPYFDLETILEATDYFSSTNKLGQGGFGPVYKGRFARGREIAVKRLSCHSKQGLEEFKNEVVLIAKLQHRNLVRLLGYCIKGDEQILLYEYMPNKSLDIFIFDRTLCFLLDWKKRFDIILGIARGLLYLHQDSRLRIIHRDLKTSNILLDDEMNPKISDFGLARIVGGKVTEVNTNRVVGTYGYMSPEYALEGLFSVKSDVYSFGVILLEIVSGKRNIGFFKSQQAYNLLGHAWKLWTEKKTLDLMDVALYETCNESEVTKCIIVGLLCVQEDPSDRPTMPNVVFMLGCETATLPNPKRPAFISKKCLSSSNNSSSRKTETVSIEAR